RAHEDGRARPDGPREGPPEGLLARSVAARARLVEHEQLGLAHERPGDEHALLLAPGQLGHGAVSGGAKTDGLERLDGLAGGVPAGAEATLAEEPRLDDLDRGRDDPRGRRDTLRDVADAVHRGVRAEWCAEQLDRARVHGDEPRDGTHEGRLARAV